MSALVERIAALNPVATSGNDAFRRLGGNRAAVLAAYRMWRETAAAPGTAAVVPVPVDAAAELERARRRAWHALDEWPP